jgi:hypothetical protein
MSGPGSSVGVATGYGLDGPGIESRTSPDRPWVQRSLLYMGAGSFQGVESGRGVTLTPHDPSSAEV